MLQPQAEPDERLEQEFGRNKQTTLSYKAIEKTPIIDDDDQTYYNDLNIKEETKQ